MCEHNNTTSLLFQAKVSGSWKDGKRQDRKYEVAFCKDCIRLVNFYGPEEAMTAEQVEAMFLDIKEGIEAIRDARSELDDAIVETLKAYADL